MSRAPFLIAALLLSLVGCSRAPVAGVTPHQIHIVGSSAAFPLSTMAAERLMREEPDAIAPLVRAGGTGEGIARFCDGPGRLHPDIVLATRAMTPAETGRCAANGVPHITSVPLGFTAFVMARAKQASEWPLTRAALYRALTAPAVQTWAEADPRLPPVPIRIEGPSPDPAIADGLFDLLLAPGCAQAGGSNCAALHIRRDGVYVGHGADAELVARALAATPGAIGLLPYAQAYRHSDTLDLLPLEGVAPTPATIAAGRYPASAPLLLLAKTDEAAAVPDLPRLLSFYADALAPDGAFASRGLIPLSQADRTAAGGRLTSFSRH
jgi:phosphate transport system substrate-binding protein